MATTDTQLQQLVINVGTDAQIAAGIASGTITEDMLSIATDGADITYDWIGTLAEYNTQDIATNHPDWLCFITDDVSKAGEDIYSDIYTKDAVDANFVAKTDAATSFLPDLFDTKYADHLLNNISWLRSNTNSWQSGKIYEAAYAHLVNDITENYTEKQEYLKSNVALYGSHTRVNSEGILGGFLTNTGYANIPNLSTPGGSLEIVIKAHTPTAYSNNSILESNVSYHGVIIRFTSATNINVWLSSNGTSWDVMSAKTNTCDVPVDSDIWVKLTWDGSNYNLYTSKDGINYINIGTQASTAPVYWNDKTASLGGCSWESFPFGDVTIDLKESYIKIDNQLAWKGVDFINYYEAADHHKIVLANQEKDIDYLYNTTGTAWYYFLDTTNERFKLPRQHSTQIVKEAKNPDNSWYRLYADGWVEQGGHALTGTNPRTVILPIPMLTSNYTITYGDDNIFVASLSHSRMAKTVKKATTYFQATGVYQNAFATDYEFDWIVSGFSAQKSVAVNGEKYLYFYVGEFTHDALVNAAGITAEQLNGKVDVGHQVIEWQAPTSENNYTWYRKYADGWVEQGGRGTTNSSNPCAVTLPVEMGNIYYSINTLGQTSTDGYTNATWQVMPISTATSPKSTTSFYAQASISGYNLFFYWEVKGMYAQA